MPHKPFWHNLHLWFIPHERNGYRPHALRHHALAAYSLILIAAKVGLTISLFLTFPNEADFSTLTAQHLVELTNQARLRIGLAPLALDERLARSADLKADDMARSGYFAHRSPVGLSPWEWFKKAGYEYTYAGENLAMDFREAEEVVEAWLESPKHRENLLNPKYRDIGIAVVTGKVNGKTVTLVVQHFGATYVGVARAAPRQQPGIAARGVRGEAIVAAGKTEVTLTEKRPAMGTAELLDGALVAFFAFAIGLALLLFLNIVIHIKIQRRGIIIAGIAVLALAVGILYLNIHFLEGVGPRPIIF